MHKHKHRILFFIFCLTIVPLIHAKISLPAIVSSNMVLQRDTDIVIWGWADPNEKIEIKTSWINNKIELQADDEGNWQTEIKTTNSQDPQTITLTGKDSNIELNNILFGEVWLCSGQSNMQMALKGNEGQPVFGSNLAIVNSYNPNLRLFTIGREGSEQPQKNLKKYTSWEQAGPDTVAGFSAVAYFFGQQLQQALHVPVGLIHTSWGSSKIETWMSKEALSKFKEVDLEGTNTNKLTQHIPTFLFNAMIHPVLKYKIKGVLWYQGESNRKEPELYKKLFPAMVKDWRMRWGIGDFPFYYVQIAPFYYGGNDPFQSPDNSAFIREVQLECLNLIPNSGIAITLDIGDFHAIHPPKKKLVADRLLYNALHTTYGFKTLPNMAPEYSSMEIKGSKMILKFKYAGSGLYTYDDLQDFEIAGSDHVFYPAKAIISKKKELVVWSDKVESPEAVRYAWSNWVVGSLFGANLLPVSSFRTDDWATATRNHDNLEEK